jgi:putative transposase
MPREPRNAYAGGYYHVYTRGNNRVEIYVDDHDREFFLRMLQRSASKYKWVVLEWCLMTTHYHFVVIVPENGLSQGMSELNGSFSRWANRRHGRCNHLFGARFNSNEIKTDEYLVGACSYVALNPVRAGLCTAPDEWRWSGYRASVGIEPPRPLHARDVLLAHFRELFGSPKHAECDVYRSFVEAGIYAETSVPVPGTGTGV